MSNNIVPKATWISDDDFLMVFHIASKLLVSSKEICKSSIDHSRYKTIGELVDAEKEINKKILIDTAMENGDGFVAAEGKLYWTIRSKHRHEVILFEVIFEISNFRIYPHNVIGDNRVELINARVDMDKKSNPVIDLGVQLTAFRYTQVRRGHEVSY